MAKCERVYKTDLIAWHNLSEDQSHLKAMLTYVSLRIFLKIAICQQEKYTGMSV